MRFKAIRESWNRNRREMGDQDAKRRKLKEKKRVFFTWPNMALTNMDKRIPNLVSK